MIYLDIPGSIILEAMPLLVRSSSFAVRNACWSVSAINQNIYSHQAFSWIGGTKSSNLPFTKVHHMKTTPATTYPWNPSIKALVAQLPQPLCMAKASLKTTGTSESWNFQPAAGVDVGGFPWFTYQNEAFMDPHAGSIMFYHVLSG